MTLTIKLEPDLEKALSARSAALGHSKSHLVREALRGYLKEPASAYETGRDLFAPHAGPTDLAVNRKAYLAEATIISDFPDVAAMSSIRKLRVPKLRKISTPLF